MVVFRSISSGVPVANILIVDDNEQFLEALKDMLESEYFTVLTAKDGLEARHVLTNQAVDVVVTDIQMPNLKGDELLKWSMANKPVPFVLMTGYSSLVEAKTAIEMGAEAYLNKPFKMADLTSALHKIISNKRSA
jgi:DNA-binding NtrC family response regulator